MVVVNQCSALRAGAVIESVIKKNMDPYDTQNDRGDGFVLDQRMTHPIVIIR
jgi:hypothetical protein